MNLRLGLGVIIFAGYVIAAPPDGLAAEPPLLPPAPGDASQTPQSKETVPSKPPARAKRMSDRCNTPAINCILLDRQPAGSSCWCVTPFGPSYGRTQ